MKHKYSKRVSVCMATYNGEKYLNDQVLSILKQLGENDELVVTDDNSTDGTVQILKSIKDDRIRIYSNETTLGYTKNFEKAISLSNGKYIILADQDDVWFDDKVSVTLKYLENYDFFECDAKITDKDLNVIVESHNKDLNVRNGFLPNFFRCRFLGCCMAFRADMKDRILPFPKNMVVSPHDYWISMVAQMYYRCIVIDEPLMLYRRHEGTTSEGGYGKKLPIMMRLYSRMYLLMNLSSRINR